MKKLLLIFLLAGFAVLRVNGQDSWLASETAGFGLSYNEYVTAMHAFNGHIYVGTGISDGHIYRSTTGVPSTWTEVFNGSYITRIDDMTSVSSGGGYLYASGYASGIDVPRVYRSQDGISWTDYYKGSFAIMHIQPFKGVGSVDTVYVFEDMSNGTIVKRSQFDSNDPSDTAGTWPIVFDFSTFSPYTNVTSTIVHNGKLYAGTNNGATLWSTANGVTWTMNTHVGYGFGISNNVSISSLCSYGGYLYAATYDGPDGSQVYRSNDDSTWTLVFQNSSASSTTDMKVAGGQLYIALESGNGGPGMIYKSSDGITFTVSNADGFGYSNNHGEMARLEFFSNNVFYGVRNMGLAAFHTSSSRTSTASTGAQVWRTCLGASPVVNLGADQLVCAGYPVTLDAGAGAVAYYWSTGDTTQTATVVGAGAYEVTVLASNGCSAVDTVVITEKPSPAVSILIPETHPGLLCRGDSLTISASANSSIYVPEAPFHKITHDTIDNTLGDQMDSIIVSGVGGTYAYESLYSVTIDSLSHTYTGDVTLGLYDPAGNFINLNYGNASGFSGFYGTEFRYNAVTPISSSTSPTFTGVFQSQDSFYGLYGNPNGAWVLRTGDLYAGDNGVLRGWTIRFMHNDTLLSFSWTPSTGITSTTVLEPTFFPAVSTGYSLTTTNSIGCTTTTPFDIYVPQLSINVPSDSICNGSSTVLTASGGYTYFWTADPTLSNTLGSTVTATPTTPVQTYYLADTVNGCPVSDSITLHMDQALTLTASPPKTICYGDTTMISATASGGTLPYSYLWNDGGSTTYNTPFVNVNPTGGTSYTVNVTDAFGCNAFNSTFVIVTPSTDLSGKVTWSGGNVTNGTAVAFKYLPYLTHFDTVQTSPIDGSGYYHFTALNHANYIVKIFPDIATYPTLIPTYYGNTFLWDSATVFSHYCGVNDTLDIVMEEQSGLTGGPGLLGGVIREALGYVRAEGDPIPGIDVKLGRNPGGQLVTCDVTDGSGYYSFSGVPLNGPGESYTVYADIPGLGRDSSYTVVLTAANAVYDSLNYVVDSATIYIVTPSTAGIAAEKGNTAGFSIYPNPSKGNCTIEYSLANAGAVSLGIYNVLGVKEAELVNTVQPAGNYKVSLVAKTFNLNSGIYFITLITDGKVITQRLVITE